MALQPSLAALRAQLRTSPFTPELARELGVSLDEHIDQVVHFVLHPREEPQLAVVETEGLLDEGHRPPREEDMARHLDRSDASPEPDSQREELRSYLESQRLKERIALD
ncbi:hypothetical protein [Stigmatella hybrida]|uniref:hypothetical protein n=1 Tax=Stigmatella hybrida TaxID=394097 RepID=UPI001CDB1684|nr:hypothetical protein [Stigmatella hybrida]